MNLTAKLNCQTEVMSNEFDHQLPHSYYILYLSHIPLSCEYNRLQPIVCVLHFLHLTNLHHTCQNLGVRQTGKPQNCTTRLDGLDNLIRRIAGQCKTCRVRIQFHGSSQSLLSSICHRICLVQNDEFVLVLSQGDLFLGKVFDLVSHNVNAPIVGGIQFQNSLFVQTSQ